jgi:hypothetical protein
MNYAKITTLFFCFFLAASICVAVPPVQTSAGQTQWLVEYPKVDAIPKGMNYSVHTHILNNSGHYLNGTQATCWLHLYNQSGSHIKEVKMVVDGFDYESYFDQTRTIGTYPFIIWCAKGSEGGMASSAFIVTNDGQLRTYSWEWPLAFIAIGFMGLLIALFALLNSENFFMQVMRLFLLLVCFYLSIAVLGLSVGFAQNHNAPQYIVSTLTSIYTVDVWIVRVFTAIVFMYLIWEWLSRLAEGKKKEPDMV